MTTTQIAVRLPAELVGQLNELVPAAYASRSDVIRRALELYLSSLAAERDAAIYDRIPLTDAELALADDPESWRDTPSW